MLFCSMAFCACKYSMDYTMTISNNLNAVKIQDGIYDDLYIDNDATQNYPENPPDIPADWQNTTILHAKFNGNLNAGSTDFVLSQIDGLIVKKQIAGSNQWQNIIYRPVSTAADCVFTELDKYVRSGVEYEYALVTTRNGKEGYMYPISITPEFEGIFIIEKDIMYHTVANVQMAVNKNRPNATINTIDNLYPYVVTNGQNNYHSGSTSAMFVRTYNNCDYNWSFYDSWKYREDLMEFLCNGKPKVLKHFDGRMYLIGVVDTPSQNESVSNYYPTTTFSWVEIGDADDISDLYNNDLTDFNGLVFGGV